MTINRPALRRLCATLRDPSSWPDGFRWDYGLCTNCAIELAHAIGLVSAEPCSEDMATALGISDIDAYGIFFEMDTCLGVPPTAITPATIADALEELLAAEVSR